jgi:proliferating cell nuclear antigen
MKLTIENKTKLEMFVALFQLLKNWGSHINLQFQEDHLYIQGMDKSHVCLANIVIQSKWFTTYSINVEQTNSAAVDSTHFAVMLNYALKHSKMELVLDATDDKLNINFVNNKETKDTFDHFFEIPLMDIEEDALGIPKIEYDVDFSIDSKKFSDLISELCVLGNELHVKCSEEVLEFNSSGDLGKLKVNIPIDDLNEFAISEGEQIETFYSLNHIGKMCMSTKLGPQITISISPDYPMNIKYDLGDDSSVSFYIAPKMKD